MKGASADVIIGGVAMVLGVAIVSIIWTNCLPSVITGEPKYPSWTILCSPDGQRFNWTDDEGDPAPYTKPTHEEAKAAMEYWRAGLANREQERAYWKAIKAMEWKPCETQ